MLRKHLDWGNIFVACSIFVMGCVLSVVSWNLGTSWTFAILYMLLGTTGFISICLLMPKYFGNKAESAPLLPVKLSKNAVKHNSERSVWECKILGTKCLLNINMDDQKLEKENSTNSSKHFANVLSSKEQNRNIPVLQHKSTKKSESNILVTDAKYSFPSQDETSKILSQREPHTDLPAIDVESKNYGCESSQAENRLNCEKITSTDKNSVCVFKENQLPENLCKITEMDSEKSDPYKNNVMLSHDNNSFKTDYVTLRNDLKETSDFERSSTKTKRSNCMLERKMSSEPTCMSCLCVNLLPQLQSNDEGWSSKMIEQSSDRHSCSPYHRQNYETERTLYSNASLEKLPKKHDSI